MLSSAWFRFGLLLAAVGLFMAATTPAVGGQPRAHGQRLVAQYQLPPDAIARYAAMAAGTALDVSPRDSSMFADRSPWVGPKQRAGAGKNPYTLVFVVSGVAKAAGEVFAQWQAGWEVHESPVASREVVMTVPRSALAGMAAGQPLTLTTNSGRVSFRGERSVAPMLGLVQTGNLDINDVQVQVWSGEGPPAWAAPAWSRSALLALGVTCLLVWSAFRYWQPVARGRGMQPARNREPPCNGHTRPNPVGCVEATVAAMEAHGDPMLAEPSQSARVVAATAAHDDPAPAEPSQSARVVAALHQVLTVGLTIASVPDEARTRKRRSPR